jgi:hypothetical protein
LRKRKEDKGRCIQGEKEANEEMQEDEENAEVREE